MPWTYGDGVLDPDDVDYAIEADEPLDEPDHNEPDDAARRIGELVAARVPDGATLQLGIGAVPGRDAPGPVGPAWAGGLVRRCSPTVSSRWTRQAHSTRSAR